MALARMLLLELGWTGRFALPITELTFETRVNGGRKSGIPLLQDSGLRRRAENGVEVAVFAER